MSPAPLFSTLVLALWLGIYAFRWFVPAAVWNLSDELPLHLKGVIAVGTHLVGLLGTIAVFKRRRRVLLPLAVAFAACTLARQLLIGSDAIGPYLALISWPLWLWFIAALANEVSTHDADALIAPAFAVACAMQLGMQAAWHGLELGSVRGPVSGGIAAILVVLLVFSTARIRRPMLERPHAAMTWLLLGPAMFLHLTLTGNVGRMSELTGMSVFTTVIVLQIALLIAVIAAERATRLGARIVVIGLGFIALFAIPGGNGSVALTVLVIPSVIVCALRESADRRVRLSGAALVAIGALVFFILIFAFYNFYEFPPLWLLAYAPLAVAAALAARPGEWPAAPRVTLIACASGLTVLYLLPPPQANERDASVITALTYNIHHGFDDDGLPGIQRTAREIARLNADLIALQEIGRGWTLFGGNDIVGYLRWRFPDYRIHYTAINGQLWGNAIMARLPLIEENGGAFEGEPGAVRYGWSVVLVAQDSVRLPFYSVHITPDLAGPMGDSRFAQTEELQHKIRGESRVLVAGDFNAQPDERPIKSFATVYPDLAEAAGAGNMNTWPAGNPSQRIDYAFGRGVAVVSADVPRTTASDHLPVLVRLRFDDTTTRR